jgi:subtilase family serine protease
LYVCTTKIRKRYERNMKKIISLTSLILMPIISLLLLQVIIVGVPVLAAPNDWSAHTLIHIGRAATASPTGLSPMQIRAAYNLPSTGGNATIAIVDAYDDPTVQNDLSVFSSQFGLPSITTANFEKHMMASTISKDSGWALEISLDVQWAHAIAPNAKILLVEARSNSLTDLLAAVDYARNRPDVGAISMSWGGSEFNAESSYDSYFTSSNGASFFASSGDNGAGVLWPAVSPNVVGVGGTTLTFAANGSLASETAWSGSGGGLSAYEAEPSYQSLYGIPGANGKRCVPDVSYDADPKSGVSVYDSTPYSGKTGWWQVGGTSAGAPQWAAIQSMGLSASNNNFYQIAKSASCSSYFRDITSGSNGYTATTGYDYVTGLGSPLTTNYAPVATPDFSISASPSALTIQARYSGSSTITVTSLNGFSGTVSLAASGLSSALSPSSLTVASGGSASATLSITVPSTTKTGTYAIIVTGTNGSLSHSAAVTVNVQTSGVKTLSVTVATDKATYSRGSYVYITVTVKDGATGNALRGASVKVTIYYPNGSVAWFGSGTTSSSGTVRFNCGIGRNAPKGTYKVAATASLTGYQTGTGQATFNVG